jgi:hypothetical protein
MNKKLIYPILALASLMVACDPAEDRAVLSGAITADQLNISATPQVIDGKNSNYIDLNSDGAPVLSSWNYGSGMTTATKTTVQLVVGGANDIVFTGRNHDGSTITKTLTVQIDTLVNVPAEWGYFCGSGEKAWVWDDTQADQKVWGNGGYLGSVAPSWWTVSIDEMSGQADGEGGGAEMVFSVAGASLTLNKSDGSSEKGSFSFDMSDVTLDESGEVWAKGRLNTIGTSVLAGVSPNEGNARISRYDILVLDNEKMVLAYPEPGAGAWGTAWFWMFRAK